MTVSYQTLIRKQENLENTVLEGCKNRYIPGAVQYVNMLFEIIPEKDLLKWQQFFLRIAQFLLDPTVKIILQHPKIVATDKLKLFPQDIFEKQGQKEFLVHLIKYRTTSLLPNIIAAFQENFLKTHKMILAKIFSPVYLSEEQTEKLQQKLEKRYQKKVIIQNYLDTDTLGGIIIYVNSKMLDYTIRGRLRRLKQYLLESNL